MQADEILRLIFAMSSPLQNCNDIHHCTLAKILKNSWMRDPRYKYEYLDSCKQQELSNDQSKLMKVTNIQKHEDCRSSCLISCKQLSQIPSYSGVRAGSSFRPCFFFRYLFRKANWPPYLTFSNKGLEFISSPTKFTSTPLIHLIKQECHNSCHYHIEQKEAHFT